MSEPTDYEQMAKIYDRGRTLPLEQIDELRVVLEKYLGPGGARVLDLGSGTGLFAEALATWFDVRVVGVEPSEAMRRKARAKAIPGVAYLGGEAEHIPLRERTCDHAWLSTVLHHIPDLRRCARELRRVLRNGGRVLIRSGFGDRLEGITWLRFFPTGREVAAQRWPSVDATVEAFATAGFRLEALHPVPEVTATSMQAYCERISTRANSTLTVIDDRAFEEGVERLRKAAASASTTEPVVDERDLLVLR
ncbi:MAG: class I SAM-dependent methyltransferase [Actinomycetota bacterium]